MFSSGSLIKLQKLEFFRNTLKFRLMYLLEMRVDFSGVASSIIEEDNINSLLIPFEIYCFHIWSVNMSNYMKIVPPPPPAQLTTLAIRYRLQVVVTQHVRGCTEEK